MLALWRPVEARLEVPAAPDVVYRVISEPTTYPDWLMGAQRIRSVDPDFPAPGSGFSHSVGPADAVTVDDRTQATAAEPPHRLALRAQAGPFTADVELVVEPRGDGSEVRFRERPSGAWAALTPLMRPVLHARNAGSLRRLREYVGALSAPA